MAEQKHPIWKQQETAQIQAGPVLSPEWEHFGPSRQAYPAFHFGYFTLSTVQTKTCAL